jgi:hypothetical protein
MTEGKYVRVDLGSDGTPHLHWPENMTSEEVRDLVNLAWGLLEDVKTGEAFDMPVEDIEETDNLEGC